MAVDMINCDCMEYMSGIQDKSFDLCITSPPYNMNLRVNSAGDGYCSRQIVREISSKYENYADNMPMDDYRSFITDFIVEACRVSRLVFFNIQQITGNKPALFKALGKCAGLLKETIIWDKINCQPSIAEGVLNSQFEFIFVFGDNPIARQFRGATFDRGTESNLWRIPSVRSKDKNHRAGFPPSLVNRVLRMFSSEGDIIFDPFLGTGTTAISAHRAGCDFVGCELDEDYYKAAKERFGRETAQKALF